jgi:3-oxoacyl-[acyl-carrier protein] reductase
MDLQLQGKVVLISGGSKGIGLATARAFAAEGAHVAICGRTPADLQAAQQDLSKRGVKVAAVQTDISTPAGASKFIDDSAAQLGGIDVLVNNAGGGFGGRSVLTTTDEEWQRTYELNLFQAVRLTRLVVPHMQKRGNGAIINVASISGWSPQLAGTPQYGSAKAALIFLTERIALELNQYKIRVNTVSPGSIQQTQGWDRFKRDNPAAFDLYVRDGFPMGRLGNPDEVADVIVYLASHRANWINGRNIPVDGLEQPVPVHERRPW